MAQPPGFWITIKEDGVNKKYPTHCTNSDWCQDVEISEDGKTIKLLSTCRLELLDTKKDGDWATHELINKRLSFDVDMSSVKKGHNFAFYSCQLTKGDEYKDAQSWDSRTELDFLEGNRIAWHTTYHRSFDRSGSCLMGIGGGLWNLRSETGKPINELYGPGQYINTDKPFHVELTHTREKARLELSQGDHKIWSEASGDYWNQLQSEFVGKRHTLVISLWEAGLGMAWLDGQLAWYDESHINRVWASISNITIDSLP